MRKQKMNQKKGRKGMNKKLFMTMKKKKKKFNKQTKQTNSGVIKNKKKQYLLFLKKRIFICIDLDLFAFICMIMFKLEHNLKSFPLF